jgi:hypothetical protein
MRRRSGGTLCFLSGMARGPVSWSVGNAAVAPSFPHFLREGGPSTRTRTGQVRVKRVRYQNQGCLHFITFSCYRRMKLLDSAAAKDTFGRELERGHGGY